MADFVDFNNAATYDGGDGGGADMQFDDLFGAGGVMAAGAANGGAAAGGGPSSIVPIVERQAVIFLIDCSLSMFAPQQSAASASTSAAAGGVGGGNATTFYHTPFSKAVKFARDFCQQKVFTAEKDLAAVVLYNSRRPLNQYSFPSIFVFQEFNSPSAPQVQELDTLSRAGIFVRSGAAADGGHAAAAARFNETTYEDFREMIGHADAPTAAQEGSDGAAAAGGANPPPPLLNPITGLPVQNQPPPPQQQQRAQGQPPRGASALSEVLWTCQHLFHFLRSTAHSNYVFTKHIMVFTDKENPVIGYAAAGAGAGANTAAHQRRLAAREGPANSNNSADKELLRRALLEYERAESRIRDLHEDGVTVEVFGYTEDPRGSGGNVNANGTNVKEEGARAGAFNPRAFWAPFLNAPAGEGAPLSDEVRRALRGMAAGIGGPQQQQPLLIGGRPQQTAGAGGGGSNNTPNSNSGNHTSNSYTLASTYAAAPNPLMAVAGGGAVPPLASSAASAAVAAPPQPIDWFSTLAPAPQQQQPSGSAPSSAQSPSANHPYSGAPSPSLYSGSGTSADPNSSAGDELQNLPKGTVRVALGRVYPLPRPGPEGKARQSLHRLLDVSVGLGAVGDEIDGDDAAAAAEAEAMEHALVAEGMMMRGAYGRQHATRSVGSLLVTFGGTAASVAGVLSGSSSSASSSSVPAIAVKVYRPIVPMAKPKFSWRHGRTNEALVTKSTYVDTATGQEVADPSKTAVGGGGGGVVGGAAGAGGSAPALVHYAEIAGDRAYFSATERQQMRTGTFAAHPPTPIANADGSVTYHDDPSPPGIRVLGFRPLAEVFKPKYSLNRAVFIHPFSDTSNNNSAFGGGATSAGTNDPSLRLFVGLHRTLTRRGLVAIAEMVSRRSGAPALVMLIPSTLPYALPSSSQNAHAHNASSSSVDHLHGYGGVGGIDLSPGAPTPSPLSHNNHHHPPHSSSSALFNNSGSATNNTSNATQFSAGSGGAPPPSGYVQGSLAVDGCGFHVVSLPYADDVRAMTAFKRFTAACPTAAAPPDSLVTVAKRIIRRLNVTYIPDAVTNPTLAHQYRQLQRLALGNDDLCGDEDDDLAGDGVGGPQQPQQQPHQNGAADDDDGTGAFAAALAANVAQTNASATNADGHLLNRTAAAAAAIAPQGGGRGAAAFAAAAAAALLNPHEAARQKRRRTQDAFDATLPHREGMQRFQPLFSAFNAAAFPHGYAPETWAPLPKPKAPAPTKDALDTIDWDGLSAAGKLGTLTMPPLQAFLKARNLSSSGTKAVLIERVTAALAREAAKRGAAAAAGGGGGVVVKPELPTQ